MSLIPAFKAGLWNAWIFMSVFLLQMLVMMLAGKRIRKRSHVPEDARRSNFEKYISIVGNLVWLAALVYSVFLPFQTGSIWFNTGLSLFIIGFVILAIATFNFINTPVDQLISNGIYRFSRHPMYLATFFICMGAGIASASWLFILLSLIMIYCFYQEALIEERYCLKIYSDYREYLNRVPRWL
ncbi:MAG: isoprenylcysteine carboxylmethyltransferase family protein [Bacteroidales bacterium]|nr:MAG: isoprenylcysteine carboxylmethyltransferase family protein [Bacteroidales bacterium]